LFVAQNFDTDVVIDLPDTPSRFFLQQTGDTSVVTQEEVLHSLRAEWVLDHPRLEEPDTDWISRLSAHLEYLVDLRTEHVREWISSNLLRFKAGHANIEELRRRFDSAAVELKANVQLCKMLCSSCHLLCLQGRLHDGPHNCLTNHQCVRHCEFLDDHSEGEILCGFPCVTLSSSRGVLMKVQSWTLWEACVSSEIFQGHTRLLMCLQMCCERALVRRTVSAEW
jgi:hypothetical protein